MTELRASYPDLKGKTVLVTGGGTGIGATTVAAFVEQGSQVAFLDIQENASEQLADSLAANGQKPLFLPCDVTDIPALREAIRKVESQLGAVKILVNNATNRKRSLRSIGKNSCASTCITISLPRRRCNRKWRNPEVVRSSTWGRAVGTWGWAS